MGEIVAIWRCCREWPVYPFLPVGKCGYCGKRPEPTDRTVEQYQADREAAEDCDERL